MDVMPYEVPLSRINEMADVSAEAFLASIDPIGNFIFHNEPNHLSLKRRFFRCLVTSCSPDAVRQGLSSALEAVSVWFPPGMDHSKDLDTDPLRPQDFTDPETVKKLQAVNDIISALTAHLGQEPQWYLHLIAVRSQFRNQGYSSRLISPMLARAENENLPCTLITQSINNLRKYEHWGFKLVKEMPVPGSQEKFYSMRKK